MKYIVTFLLLISVAYGQKKSTPRTRYFLIGYTALTKSNESIVGSCYIMTYDFRVDSISNYINRNAGNKFKKVILLSFSEFRSKEEMNLFDRKRTNTY